MLFSELDKRLQGYIVQADDFEAWAAVLEERVIPWIRKQGNKALWDMVLFVSQRMGIVKEKLSRVDFARLVIRVCPSLQGEKPETLRASMEKMKGFTSKRKKDFERMPDNAECRELRRLYAEIEKLLKAVGKTKVSETDNDDSLASRLEATLRQTLHEEPHAPCSRLRLRRLYRQDAEHSIQPVLSLETYTSDEFLLQQKPSFVLAYECVDRQVTRDDVRLLWYHYSAFRYVKLVIVSSAGFAWDVIRSADSNSVGLIRVTSTGTLEPVLPRSMNDYFVRERQMQALAGEEMEGQLLIHDNLGFHSLGTWLKSLGFSVERRSLPRVPYHPDTEIIRRVNSLHSQLWLLHEFEVRGMDRVAEGAGISIKWGRLPEGQLGRLDLRDQSITLNISIKNDEHRLRFTLAHELGHYFLHADDLKEHFTSFGETDTSLSGKYDNGDEMRWIEYQANFFASVLLMPENHVFKLASRVFDERELHDGYLWYDDQPRSWARYNYIVSHLSAAMNVSKTAVRLRMKKLGLLREESTSKRLREIIKE